MANLTFKGFLILAKDAYFGWNNDNAMRMGAALSYFAIFSMAPVLIIAMTISSLVFGVAAAEGELFSRIAGLIGPSAADFIQNMITNAHQSRSTALATIFGVIMLIGGAMGVFLQLRESLYTIWHLKEKPQGTIKGFLIDRLLSLAMILSIGFLLIVFLLFGTAISAFEGAINVQVPGLGNTLRILDLAGSFIVVSIMFALIFKFLPHARVRWRDIWLGTMITSVLFTLGKYLIGMYLGKSGVSSSFGAASSLVIIMLWTFYSSLIMLYGAEFIKFYSERFGVRIRPEETKA